MARRGSSQSADHDKEPHSPTSTDSTLQLDSIAEKKLLRKVDIHLIPILFLLFLCAFIDR